MWNWPNHPKFVTYVWDSRHYPAILVILLSLPRISVSEVDSPGISVSEVDSLDGHPAVWMSTV